MARRKRFSPPNQRLLTVPGRGPTIEPFMATTNRGTGRNVRHRDLYAGTPSHEVFRSAVNYNVRKGAESAGERVHGRRTFQLAGCPLAHRRSTPVGRLAVEIDQGRPVDRRRVGGRRCRLRTRGHERSCQLDEHGAQVRAIANEIDGARAGSEQKGERRLIALYHVAAGTGEDEVVAPIVCRLSTPRRDVVESHHGGGETHAAIGAYWSVLRQQPCARFDVGVAARRMRRQLDSSAGRSGAPATTASFCAGRCLYSAIVWRMRCVRCMCYVRRRCLPRAVCSGCVSDGSIWGLLSRRRGGGGLYGSGGGNRRRCGCVAVR